MIRLKFAVISLLFFSLSIAADDHKTKCSWFKKDGDVVELDMDVSVDGNLQTISFTSASEGTNFVTSTVTTHHNDEPYPSNTRSQQLTSGEGAGGTELLQHLLAALHYYHHSPPAAGRAFPVGFVIAGTVIASLIPVEVLTGNPQYLDTLHAEPVYSLTSSFVYTNLIVSTGADSETSFGVSLEETVFGYELIVYSGILTPHGAADPVSAASGGFPAANHVHFINTIDLPTMQAVTGMILSQSEASGAVIDVGT